MCSGESHTCFHCGLPVPEGIDLKVKIKGEERDMCCFGCHAVAEAIVANNLEAYYSHRTKTNDRPDELVPSELSELTVYDDESLQKTFVSEGSGDTKEASLILEGIVCAACVWVNERYVSKLPGVVSFSVNYSTHRAQLVWDDSLIKLSDVLAAIAAIGYSAHPFDPARQEQMHREERSVAIRKLGVAGVGAMQVMMLAVAMYLGDYQGMDRGIRSLMEWSSLVITIPVLLYSAQTFFRSAWRDIRRSRLGMDVPVSIAILGAFSASVWHTFIGDGEVYFDSVTMFTFFLLLGRFLEMSARHRAGQAADELVKLMPSTAHLKRGTEFVSVPVTELRAGDHVLVKPGEAIPADGIVVEGESSVNESLLTGESLPQVRAGGDQLIGGTVNIESPLTMQVEKLGAETVLASISRLLEQAQAEKPAIAALANRVAAWFVAVLLLVAACVYGYWHINNPEEAFRITLSVLVVTCPCALSLATPVALTAVTGSLTTLGVLVTRGTALETLARVTDIIFDKTGTLTHGKLELSKTQKLGDMETQQARAIAAGLEQFSEHPVATALKKDTDAAECSDVTVVTAQGVRGLHLGKTYDLGKWAFVTGEASSAPAEIEGFDGGTVVYLGSEGKVLAAFLLSDTLREEAPAAISQLISHEVKPHLLSGDNESVVSSVAQALGIDDARAAQLPADKLAYVKQLQDEGRIVAMVGDGVNDAPVLAGAHVSVAMGNGAQLAQASSDIVLLSENLGHLDHAIIQSRKTLSVIRQNLMWAVGYNLVALPLAAMGFIAPWMAAIGMSLSSLIVVLNALRLKGERDNSSDVPYTQVSKVA